MHRKRSFSIQPASRARPSGLCTTHVCAPEWDITVFRYSCKTTTVRVGFALTVRCRVKVLKASQRRGCDAGWVRIVASAEPKHLSMPLRSKRASSVNP